MLDFQTASVQTGAQATSKEEAIRKVAELLEKNGYVASHYAESMLRRETLANTYLGQGIAIPHGVPADRGQIRKTGIAVLQVPQGISWQAGETARLIIGIAAKSDEHLELLGKITELISQPELAERLAVTPDAEEIVAALTASTSVPGSSSVSLSSSAQSVEALVGPAHGLHARPATCFAAKAREFAASIRVSCGARHADGKSMASLLQLGAEHGTKLLISAEGVDAERALVELKAQMEASEVEENTAKGKLVHSWKPNPEGKFLRGVSISPGLVIARLHRLGEEAMVTAAPTESPMEEKRQLHLALDAALEELQSLKEDLKSRGSASASQIFAAQAELLQDQNLIVRVEQRIDSVPSASYAWQQEMERLAKKLAASGNPLTAARATDVRDTAHRVLRLLLEIQTQRKSRKEELSSDPVIWLARELTPSQTATIDPKCVAGFCTVEGSATSHVAILARSLNIPAISGLGAGFDDLEEDELVILDAVNGILYRDPTALELAAAQQAREELADVQAQVYSRRFRPAIMTDGIRIEVCANIGKAKEASQALEAGGEGIGLLRTEFLFLDREFAPSEEEQYETYRKILEDLDGLPLVLRTLDIGGDKPVPYLQQTKEENPFLGVRGIRLCLRNRNLFRTQLRAAYRASSFGNLKIMFPMIATLEDMRSAKAFADGVRRELGVPAVETGAMIEVPSAVVMAKELAREADFFSVGTNDLTQYVLAMDRGNAELAKEAQALHPAVLRMISQTAEAATSQGKWVGVCGGLAGEPAGALLLTGLGVRELSMAIPSIPEVKETLRSFSLAEAEALAHKAIACGDLASVRELLHQQGVQA